MAARVKDLSAPKLDESELKDEQTEHLVALARRKRERSRSPEGAR